MDTAFALALVPACAALAGDVFLSAVAASASAAEVAAAFSLRGSVRAALAVATSLAVLAVGGSSQHGNSIMTYCALAFAAAVAPAAVSAAHSWKELKLGGAERLISIQCILVAIAAAARCAWLAFAVPLGWDRASLSHAASINEDDAVQYAVTALMGGSAFMFVSLAGTFRSHSRSNPRVLNPDGSGLTANGTHSGDPNLHQTWSSGDTALSSDGRASSNHPPSVPLLLVCAVIGGTILTEYAWLWTQLGVEPFRWVWRSAVDSLPNRVLTAWWAAALLMLLVAVEWLQSCNGPAVPDDSIKVVVRPTSRRRCCGIGGGGGRSCCPAPLLNVSQHRRNLLLRKAFHVAGYVMFAPAVAGGRDTQRFLALAFAVAAQLLCVLEFGRSLRLPPRWLFGRAHDYMTQYTDERDSGVFVVTHIYLLLGCAAPLWLSLFGSPILAPSDTSILLLAAQLAGITALGVGDAAAAVVGISVSAMGWGHTWGSVLAEPPTASVKLSSPPNMHGSSGHCGDVSVFSSTPRRSSPRRKVTIDDGSTQVLSGRANSSSNSNNRPSLLRAATTALVGNHSHVSAVSSSVGIPLSWPGERKTVEGSAAFALASVASIVLSAGLQGFLLRLRAHSSGDSSDAAGSIFGVFAGSWPHIHHSEWAALWVCSLASAAVETFSGTIDNLVLPPLYWGLLVCAHRLILSLGLR